MRNTIAADRYRAPRALFPNRDGIGKKVTCV